MPFIIKETDDLTQKGTNTSFEYLLKSAMNYLDNENSNIVRWRSNIDLRKINFMSLDTAEKQKLIETHQVHPTDTGSVEVQVAMLSKRISKLSDHLQGNIHDFASRQGLLKMIGKRKRLLSFIKDKNVQRYQELVKKIGIRGWFQLMKKKQSKKKTQFKKKKNYPEKTAFANLEKASSTATTPKRSSTGIPKYVADRMARRIFFTAGIPTILGMSVFVVSYIIVTRNIAEIPPSSTIAISALFFLLGLAGLSFGILSASWDKEPGSFFGIENIPMNIQRAKAAFKPATQNFEDKS